VQRGIDKEQRQADSLRGGKQKGRQKASSDGRSEADLVFKCFFFAISLLQLREQQLFTVKIKGRAPTCYFSL
jgi:hypothetical protein